VQTRKIAKGFVGIFDLDIVTIDVHHIKGCLTMILNGNPKVQAIGVLISDTNGNQGLYWEWSTPSHNVAQFWMILEADDVITSRVNSRGMVDTRGVIQGPSPKSSLSLCSMHPKIKLPSVSIDSDDSSPRRERTPRRLLGDPGTTRSGKGYLTPNKSPSATSSRDIPDLTLMSVEDECKIITKKVAAREFVETLHFKLREIGSLAFFGYFSCSKSPFSRLIWTLSL
jgi:hypothetical protein